MILVIISVAAGAILASSFLASQSTLKGVRQNIVAHAQARQNAETGLRKIIAEVRADKQWRSNFKTKTKNVQLPLGSSSFALKTKTGKPAISKKNSDGTRNNPNAGGNSNNNNNNGNSSTLSVLLADDEDSLPADVTEPITLSAVTVFEGTTYTAKAVIVSTELHSQTILMAVQNASSLTQSEKDRIKILEDLGWTVHTVSENNITTNTQNDSVIYIPAAVTASATLAAAITALGLPLVSESPALHASLGLSSAAGQTCSDSKLYVADLSHYITSAFTTTTIPITSKNQTLGYATGTLASGATTLAKESSGIGPALVVMEQTTASATPVDFTISNDVLVPNESFTVKITALGAAISYGGSYDMPVTMKIKVDCDAVEPFGDFDKPVEGNLNDDADAEVFNDPADCPRVYVLPNSYEAGDQISVRGQIWKLNGGATGSSNSHWSSYRTVDSLSTADNARIYTLRDGDNVPNISGFGDQSSMKDVVSDYINTTTNKMSLDANEVIYCFELGSSTTGSSADFQDLVVLVTLAKNASELDDDCDDDDDGGSPAAGPNKRKVFLPWGGSDFKPNYLNASGKTLLDRSLKWAAGMENAAANTSPTSYVTTPQWYERP